MTSLVKFAIVGSVGLVIDFSITLLLRDVLFVNSYLATGCGFMIAAGTNYYSNSRWTFRTNTTAPGRQFALFFIISLIGLGLNIVLLYFFQRHGVPFYISKALAIVFVFTWNFTANSVITFSSFKTIIITDADSSLFIKLFIKTKALNANK